MPSFEDFTTKLADAQLLKNIVSQPEIQTQTSSHTQVHTEDKNSIQADLGKSEPYTPPSIVTREVSATHDFQSPTRFAMFPRRPACLPATYPCGQDP